MLINYSISLKALDRYVEQYNKRQDTVKTKVRTAMIYTAKELLKIYGVSLRKDNEITPVTLDHIPGLRTNNMQLAKRTQGCGRTMQRHIDRLLSAGVITQKITHGSNASYEIFMHPDILQLQGISKRPSSKKESKTQKGSKKESGKDTSLENSSVQTIKQGIESLRKAWQKKGNTKKQTPHNRDKGAESHTEQQRQTPMNKDKKEEFHTEQQRQTPQNRDKKKESHTEQQRQTPKVSSDKDSFRDSRIALYIADLWREARDKLYDTVLLTPEQGTIAKRLLHQWYEPIETAKLEQIHKVYLARVDLVEKYLKKEPNRRFVQLPYLYFDLNNPNGFAGTKQWYIQQRDSKEKTRLELILAHQIRKFKRNEQLESSKRRPRLTVFRECEQRIGKLKQPELLQKFYAAVLLLQKSEC